MPDTRDRVRIGQLGTPEDVAGVVAFRYSHHASYLAAELIDVKGGSLFH